MKISAYTFVRNGLKMSYPFIESIKSILSIVDEYIVVLGDSDDGSREAIQKIGSEKIRIIDTVWDSNLRKDGKLFALQSNIGLDHATGDWIIHLQADEVIHERELIFLQEAIAKFNDNAQVEGLLFPFLNFWGSYYHIHTGRQAHRSEIRAFKRNPLIRSYRDSQGFRKYSSLENYMKGERGEKLQVAKINTHIFHYSYVRPPKLMKIKVGEFMKQYMDDDGIERALKDVKEFDYSEVDKLESFTGSHPAVMLSIVEKQDWKFVYDPTKNSASLRHRLLNKFEEWTGYRIGEYKNYKLIR